MSEPQTPSIVVCGEALIDLFVSSDADGKIDTVAKLAGAPYNLAIGLARLGEKVALCAGLSTDLFGKALRHALVSEGVSDIFLEEYTEPTMLVLVSRDAQGSPSYSFPVSTSAERQLTGRRFRDAHSPVDVLVLGSYLMVFPDPQKHLLGIVADKKSDTLICLDPNIRLGIVPDTHLWREAVEKFLPLVDMVKASEEDIAALYPDVPVDTVAAAWLAKGARLVIVTAGGEGATAWLGTHEKVTIKGEAVNVIDTVGAGDSFLAAFLWSVSEHHLLTKTGLAALTADILVKAMQVANKAASITCSRLGADLPDRATLAKYAGQD
jgi:fructokinase